MSTTTESPPVRISLRWKITIPFILIALILALGATVAISRLSVQAEQLRFLRQLRDSGQRATDEVVRIEDRMLEIERAIANTEGVADAVALGDAEALRERILGLIINSKVDVAVVLERDGNSLLASRRTGSEIPEILRGEGYYSDWPFVERVLGLEEGSGSATDSVGIKQAGMQTIRLADRDTMVFFVAAPLVTDAGTVLGAVLVGEYLDHLVEQLGQDARATVSIYDSTTGQLLSTTFEDEETWEPPGLPISQVLLESVKSPETASEPYRTIQVAGRTYGEVLTPFVVRLGTEELGIMGIALFGAEDPDLAYQAYQERITSIILVGALALILVVLVGLLISHSITRPLVDIAAASSQVASGNLDTHVSVEGGDEIGVLAQTFNRMVEQLRESDMDRTLLRRTMSPQVRARIRETFTRGGAFLQGQAARGTILVAELRGFPSAEDVQDPSELLQILNDYFGRFVNVIDLHGGVLHKFDGMSLTAIFGVLPRNLPPQVSALQATHAGFEMLDVLTTMNRQGMSEGSSAVEMGIGISTGMVVTGGLTTEDQMHYTVIGDAVRTAEAIQRITREPSSANLLISEDTYRYLEKVRSQFEFGREGRAKVDEGEEVVGVHEIRDRTVRLIEM
ncbi:MAG: HAMP domain-containing protein [Anaerolineales bacterium]|nr:HAMP domain-containing protein [Anaerolineales bacterium]